MTGSLAGDGIQGVVLERSRRMGKCVQEACHVNCSGMAVARATSGLHVHMPFMANYTGVVKDCVSKDTRPVSDSHITGYVVYRRLDSP